MPYTPYTLQTILTSARPEEPIPSSTSSTSFFSRRPTSPPADASNATITRNVNSRIESIGAWGTIRYDSMFQH